MSRMRSRLVFVLPIVIALVIGVRQMTGLNREEVSYDKFVDLMYAGRLERITLEEDKIEGTFWDGTRANTIKFRTTIVPSTMSYIAEVITDYRNSDGAIPFQIRHRVAPRWFLSPFWWIVLILLVAVACFLWQRGKDSARKP